MPRKARVKSEEAVYHVMVRSISEIKIFEERDDKLKYIFFFKRGISTYKFKVLAYCIMERLRCFNDIEYLHPLIEHSWG